MGCNDQQGAILVQYIEPGGVSEAQGEIIW